MLELESWRCAVFQVCCRMQALLGIYERAAREQRADHESTRAQEQSTALCGALMEFTGAARLKHKRT